MEPLVGEVALLLYRQASASELAGGSDRRCSILLEILRT
jgi:hypothetical protein